jgi:uncharacterized phage infection (PIP) family protein YhgE
MDCPRCHRPSPEGKKYCADCGAPLDPQTTYLASFVQKTVQDEIDKRFKDQRLVDIETSQAIAERLHGWAKIFAYCVGLPVAALFIVLSVAGIEKYSDFRNLINSVEQGVRPRIEQAKVAADQAQHAADAAKNETATAERTLGNVTSQINKQLGSATEITNNVRALSIRVTELEKQSSDQIRASSQRVEARVSELDQKFDTANKDIAEQQKKLASTDELVKALFSKGVTEYFQTATNSPTTVIVPLKSGAWVFMLLKSQPIFQTIEVKWRVFSQPRGSYGLSNNVLFFSWGDPSDNLKQNPLEVTYVPDPTAKIPTFRTLSVRDGGVFADETKLMDLPK